ncbi:hypothetical protein FCN77_21090 [Arthrobacter sp. 24S4-2]|uniref:hypothetical protein n=1 Tax=Arthrobacter sp. 24S4-2 TaxID=2575374 RepID=UPI0010C7D10B|nr:hypothetical protein [Arthrobacter sp. 24S4-2]QCO99745.1 hypothetical protein FCN77_21090 [Arthrobacter sp. 24S4-2]
MSDVEMELLKADWVSDVGNGTSWRESCFGGSAGPEAADFQANRESAFSKLSIQARYLYYKMFPASILAGRTNPG